MSNKKLRKEMASDILSKHQKCEDAIRMARKSAGEAAVLAWEIGNDLKNAKGKLNGEFTQWLDQELRGISTATAYRYMKLAKLFPKQEELDEKIKNNKSLTTIYRESGILPSKEGKSTEVTPIARFVRQVQQLSTSLENVGSKLSDKNWKAEEVTKFLEMLKKLNDFAGTLGTKAESDDTRQTIGEEVEILKTRKRKASH